MEHRLVTIVFIDMQGYTKRSAGQSVEEMKRFHDEFHSFVNNLVEEHGGVLVKSLGDGVLVRFDSPTKAVQCSYEMQQQLMSRNEDILNPDKIVRFRIGINTGDVIVGNMGSARRLSYTVLGSPVNLAQRLEANAPVEGIMISQRTWELVKDHVATRVLEQLTGQKPCLGRAIHRPPVQRPPQ
jgi:adenylate cyclase